MRGALALLVLVASASDAGAVSISDGGLVISRTAEAIGGYDAAANRWRVARFGANGEMFVTELNPDSYQNSDQTIVSIALVANQANTTSPATGAALTPFDASIYGYKWISVAATAAANAATPWSVRFWGSTDGITYKPLTKGTLALTAGHRFGPAIAVDTLKIQSHGVSSTGWFPLALPRGELVTLKKIVAVASVDSAVGTATIVVQVGGRQH